MQSYDDQAYLQEILPLVDAIIGVPFVTRTNIDNHEMVSYLNVCFLYLTFTLICFYHVVVVL
jgi:hypothetical protein